MSDLLGIPGDVLLFAAFGNFWVAVPSATWQGQPGMSSIAAQTRGAKGARGHPTIIPFSAFWL
jgi:hypothetical protein